MRLRPAPAPVDDAVCTDIAEGLALCFACGDTLLTQQQQQAWGVSTAQLLEQARTASAHAIGDGRPVRQDVADSPGHHYWISAAQDGYDMAALLHPEALSASIGATPVIGVPGRGALIAWVPGDRELDTMVAVGIKTMHEQAAFPVSDKLYQYTDGEWTIWGEARKTDPF